MINFGSGASALARDSILDRSGYEAYALTGILLRHSERTTFGMDERVLGVCMIGAGSGDDPPDPAVCGCSWVSSG
jgi:hypothetical protein